MGLINHEKINQKKARRIAKTIMNVSKDKEK
jgi:hypothetical protein